MAHRGVLALALALAAATSFAPRVYVRHGDDVVVDARPDAIAFRTTLAPAELASRVANYAKVRGAHIVRRGFDHDGLDLVVVDLAPQTPEQLAFIASHFDHAYPVLARESGRAFADDRLVVTAQPGALDRVVAAVVAKTGGSFVRASTVPDTALLSVDDAVDASARLRNLDGLVSAEPDLVRELRVASVIPNDPLFAKQWHLSRQDSSVPGTGQIFADIAWDTTQGDPSTVVAVFDTGVDTAQPDLAPNIAAALAFDAVDPGDDDPSPHCTASFDGSGPASDCPSSAPFRESHGTAVSGIVAAVSDNGIGVAGVCPKCTLIPVRIIGDDAATGLGIAEAFIKAVDEGADVINNSWGPGLSLYFPLSTAEQRAFDYAKDTGRGGKGTVIVFASGNDTSDVANDAYAANPYVIAVSASTNVDDWALYSNFGKQISVAAPSQGLLAQQDAFPDDDFGIVTTDITGAEGYDSGDDVADFNGTSAAAPVAAGVAALVVSANPALTAEQVRLILTRTADKIVADKFPWGDEGFSTQEQEFLFSYDATGQSNAFGYGRVNAANAVALAVSPDVGLEGALCSEPGCPVCSPESRCVLPCTKQSDCVDGTVCDRALGTCDLPRDGPVDFGAPCSADCAVCTPTLDTALAPASICTTTCASDDDCRDGFACRLTARGGPSICAVGSKNAGQPDDFFQCFNQAIGSALVVVTDSGKDLCSDVCFGDAPGACPYGFHCAEASCTCTQPAQGDACFTFTCSEGSGFGFEMCLPNPGFADDCESDIDCQRGDYCKDGTCRLDDRRGCDICAPCSRDEDCDGRGTCIGLRGGGIGQCSWECEDSDPCPGDSVCRPVLAGDRTIKVCMSPEGGEDGATRCDPSYSCRVPCRDDVPCASGETCVAGACVTSPTSTQPSAPISSCHCGGVDGASLAGVVALAVYRRKRRQYRKQPSTT